MQGGGVSTTAYRTRDDDCARRYEEYTRLTRLKPGGRAHTRNSGRIEVMDLNATTKNDFV